MFRFVAILCVCLAWNATPVIADDPGPFVVVLGIAQDGGVPQAGSDNEEQWTDPARKRHVTCLAIVDPRSSQRWILDCTPDFPGQLHRLDEIQSSSAPRRPLDGIFLTHGHIGHYTGLMWLGHEAMGASGVPVYAMPRMAEYLSTSGPWSQLVRYENIEIRHLEDGVGVSIAPDITVTPFLVPHRQEYTEVVGYRIDGPRRSALFIPDIDSWEQFDDMGTRIEDLIAGVDVAWLDGTFSANGEIPGRDMSGFPHPFIVHSLERFAPLPESERAKVRFIHFNHTNPVLWPDTEIRNAVGAAGCRVADEGERVDL